MILTRKAGVQFLVRETRSHKLHGAAKTRKQTNKRSSFWCSGSAGRWADLGQARLGHSASGCRPTGHSSSMLVGLRLPQVGSPWGPAKGQWLQGGVLAMAEERVPLHMRMSTACFITSTNIHWPEQVTRPSPISVGEDRGTICLQGEEEGEYLLSKPNYSPGILHIFLKDLI